MNPLRLIAQWYISRSLDLDLPMPRWVASRIERDPQLRSFYHSSLQLMHQLQGRATEYSLEHPTVVLHRGKATRPSWTWAAFGTMAATLAILVLWLPLQKNFGRRMLNRAHLLKKWFIIPPQKMLCCWFIFPGLHGTVSSSHSLFDSAFKGNILVVRESQILETTKH